MASLANSLSVNLIFTINSIYITNTILKEYLKKKKFIGLYNELIYGCVVRWLTIMDAIKSMKP